MKKTRKQKRAENRRRHRALRRLYLSNKVVTYDDLIARDMNPRRKKRRNPKHDGSPTRGELKAARRAAREAARGSSRHSHAKRGGKRHPKSAAYHRVTSDRSSGSHRKLIDMLGLIQWWESQDPSFWDNLPDDLNGKRAIKAMWILAKQQGISTKAALDSFKAAHVRQILASAEGVGAEAYHESYDSEH